MSECSRPMTSLLVLLTSAIAACGASGKIDPDDGGANDSAVDAATDALTLADTGQADTSPVCEAGTQPGGDGGCAPIVQSARRPFLVGRSLRSAVVTERRDWSRKVAPVTGSVDVKTAEALAQSWLQDGLEEHASVAAFARFTMHLLSVGAPPDLVGRSQRASLDEIEHARSCFALAERLGKRPRGPSSLRIDDAVGPVSLAEIAALTAEEGCVGETLGAVLAAEQLARASDPETVKVLRRIAADEARHAELAWRFAKWAVVNGGEDVKQAIGQAAERAIQATLDIEIRAYDGIDLDAWHAHGRLTCSEARALMADAVREIVCPCLAAVMERDAPQTTRLGLATAEA